MLCNGSHTLLATLTYCFVSCHVSYLIQRNKKPLVTQITKHLILNSKETRNLRALYIFVIRNTDSLLEFSVLLRLLAAMLHVGGERAAAAVHLDGLQLPAVLCGNGNLG